jgi:hypothetical protein
VALVDYTTFLSTRIVRIQGARLDVPYIEHWLKTFGDDDARTVRFRALVAEYR